MNNVEAKWYEKAGRWACSVGSGKDRKWFYCKIAGPAGKEIAEKKKREFLQGEEPMPKGTLAAFIQEVWWPGLKIDSSHNTLRTYKYRIEAHLQPLLGIALNELRLDTLQSFVADLKEKQVKGKDEDRPKLSPRTVNEIYSLLSGILNLAHEAGQYDHLDFNLVRTPKIPRSKKPERTQTELEKLLKAAAGTPIEQPILWAARLGLRRGEVCGLTTECVQLVEQSRLGPHALLTISNNRQAFGLSDALKNQESGEERILAIPIRWGRELLACRKVVDISGHTYLFTNDKGAKIHPDAISKAMPELCERAGIKQLKFKDLRAFCRSNLQSNHQDPATIMRALGHKSLGVSMEYQEERLGEILNAYNSVAESEGKR